MEIPTIGRRLWYFPCPADLTGAVDTCMTCLDPNQPFDAGVNFVAGDAPQLVNLHVTDHSGVRHIRNNVPLLDGPPTVNDDPEAWHVGWAEWMPYQRAQSAKHDATLVGKPRTEQEVSDGMRAAVGQTVTKL